MKTVKRTDGYPTTRDSHGFVPNREVEADQKEALPVAFARLDLILKRRSLRSFVERADFTDRLGWGIKKYVRPMCCDMGATSISFHPDRFGDHTRSIDYEFGNDQKWSYMFLKHCPFCGARLTDPTPAMMEAWKFANSRKLEG